VLITVSLLFAAGLVLAADQETVVQLKQRAMAVTGAEQTKLFLEIAKRQLKAADGAFSQGQIEQGKVAVEEVADYCQKAGTAATTTGKYLKQTEIEIRALIRRLDAISSTLSFEDRAPLAAAIERMEQVRSDLLNAMFAPKS
jgi:hypothetical protein